MWRSTVLTLTLQLVFPDLYFKIGTGEHRSIPEWSHLQESTLRVASYPCLQMLDKDGNGRQ